MNASESNKSRTKINRLGEINYNKHGEKIIIVDYKSAKNIIVEFENGFKINTQYINFKLGNLITPYTKTNCGIGYLGEGKYTSQHKYYKIWSSMLKRCYSENEAYGSQTKYVCEEWLNFQNFAKWCDENYYELDDERVELDKDILIKNNGEYSPSTCLFVPRRINSLFVNMNKKGELPLGVSYHKKQKKYVGKLSTLNGSFHLGYYNSPIECWLEYKNYKELYIKIIANDYKDVIPKKLYNAMLNYTLDLEVVDCG